MFIEHSKMKNVFCNWWGKTQWDCPKPASLDAKIQNRYFNLIYRQSILSRFGFTYASIVKRISNKSEL